ncbi:hypothetical protein BD626DRAFT_97788 [Schizophyllum amplum]|uniref:Secreted protein n=1 Tax=Schizophyllum amplum TaxID=97359 RepID=A0A550BRW6_9AGAR|nr:hypothetical protein BD626DRAFT_97788 [Auriculariopsis ampla]
MSVRVSLLAQVVCLVLLCESQELGHGRALEVGPLAGRPTSTREEGPISRRERRGRYPSTRETRQWVLVKAGGRIVGWLRLTMEDTSKYTEAKWVHRCPIYVANRTEWSTCSMNMFCIDELEFS